jgi:hypothetical protein
MFAQMYHLCNILPLKLHLKPLYQPRIDHLESEARISALPFSVHSVRFLYIPGVGFLYTRSADA